MVIWENEDLANQKEADLTGPDKYLYVREKKKRMNYTQKPKMEKIFYSAEF